MHGNVGEWCDDAENPDDRVPRRMCRGGSWDNPVDWQRAAFRTPGPPSARWNSLGLRVARVPAGKDGAPDVRPGPAAFPSLDPNWLKGVQAQPAAGQIEAVYQELLKRNPGFGGRAFCEVTPGPDFQVKSYKVENDKVADLTPVQVFRRLESLTCIASGPGKGKLGDLSPLRGMALKRLEIPNNPVADFGPLREMPLEELVAEVRPERDGEVLRSIKTLQRINGKPAAEFWKETNAKAPGP
jgi:hypothetical protein